MSLHLNVLHEVSSEDQDPSSVSRLFNPYRYDFYWNKDCTAYRPIALQWWDDASYIAYQCGDNERD